MRIVTFEKPGGGAEAGILAHDQVFPLGAEGYGSVMEFIASGEAGVAKAAKLLEGNAERYPAGSVKLLAPIPRPPKIICVGLNYRDHAMESNMEIPKVPTIFCKFPTSVIGPGEAIVLPKNSEKPDYEAEFAVVIGKEGRHIAAEKWREHVFGYTNLNDVSARDFQMATTQWIMGKTFDTFCPMGPAIVTADEIADPHKLDIKITINGEVLQSSNTEHLIFRIPDLIAHLSSVFTLEAGDIISTGTPAGVGFARKPPRWLRAGDDVVVEVAGLGALRNPVVAE
ncbi:MAG: fumarylacetoacetate hydrolase family protein [Acidimicrobiia bacterium]|nr:fumarylacetoacetate hydrolase family protein [Acidimicrobiia bacterium]